MKYQKAALAYFTLVGSGIKGPKDLVGRKIGEPPGSAMRVLFPAFAEANGFDKDKVKFIHMSPATTIPSLLAGKVDAIGLYTSTAPILILRAKKLGKKVRQRRKEREGQILEMKRPLDEALAEAGVPAEVTGRPKHLWSIYCKMVHRGVPYADIYDLMAMRVLTDSVQNCYAALGVIHNRWTPVQDRFHDFIATPKSNMYRSLHTTVIGPGGRRYEIQIRSEEMHRTAEYGIAAHWRYKEGLTEPDPEPDEVDEALIWFRQVLEWQKDTDEPEEFMEFLRMDLFQGEMFVFTPKGEVRQLPVGATPIDFAFAVHTEVGLHCAGARVNGRIAPLSRELKNGETIEILTNPKQWPNRDWLVFVKTSRARGRIKQWIRKQEYDSAVELGREFLDREIFYSLKEAQLLIEQWRELYNEIRPHSALGCKPPAPAAMSSRTGWFSLLTSTGSRPGLAVSGLT